MDSKKTSEKIKRILIIDTAYLDKIVYGFIGFLNKQNISTPCKAQMAQLAEYFAVFLKEKQIEEGGDIFLLHHESKEGFTHFLPESFNNDYKDKGFKSEYGDFSFYTFPFPTTITINTALESLATLLKDKKESLQVIFIGDQEQHHFFKECIEQSTKITYFFSTMAMDTSPDIIPLGFALLTALGIKSEHL